MPLRTYADLSHHQGTVDLLAYAAAGHDRVVLKATEGADFVDPRFRARWAVGGQARLGRGAYHYGHSETGGAAQADHFLSVVTSVGGLGTRDWLILDIEDVDSAAAEQRADEFCGEFTRRAVALGYPAGELYTGRWYADPANIRADDLPAGWQRLWLSDYTDAGDAGMALPAGWSRGQVTARQYTNNATIPGVSGKCDYSRLLTQPRKKGVPVYGMYQQSGKPEVYVGGPGVWWHVPNPRVESALIAAGVNPVEEVTAAQLADMAAAFVQMISPALLASLKSPDPKLDMWHALRRIAAEGGADMAKRPDVQAALKPGPLTDDQLAQIADAVIDRISSGVTVTIHPTAQAGG